MRLQKKACCRAGKKYNQGLLNRILKKKEYREKTLQDITFRRRAVPQRTSEPFRTGINQGTRIPKEHLQTRAFRKTSTRKQYQIPPRRLVDQESSLRGNDCKFTGLFGTPSKNVKNIEQLKWPSSIEWNPQYFVERPRCWTTHLVKLKNPNNGQMPNPP